MEKSTKKELKERVEKAKRFMKGNGISQAEAVNAMYGPMFYKEHLRMMNLFRGYITSEEFTEKLENWLRNRNKTTGDEVFNRFLEFADWYNKLGGRSFTPQEIDELITKFR